MAHTCDPPHKNTRCGGKTTEPATMDPGPVVSKATGSSKKAPKKHSHDKDDTTAVEQPGPTKKAKVMATKSQEALETQAAPSPGQQPVQNKAKVPAVTQKRK